jgi:hypothetical protein
MKGKTMAKALAHFTIEPSGEGFILSKTATRSGIWSPDGVRPFLVS